MAVVGVIGAVILWTIISKILEWREEKNEEEVRQHEVQMAQDVAVRQMYDQALEQKETTMEETKGTRDLFLGILTKIGCQYEIDEEDNQISFKWQGGNFSADTENDCPFVVVWYLYWDEYELYDIDALSRVKRVINDANIRYNVNVVYSVNEAGSTFHVHSKKHFLFISQIPDIEGYLQSILGQIFQVRHYVDSELIKLKGKEENVSQ